MHDIAVLEAAAANGLAIEAHPKVARARSILSALEASLDFREGGDLAVALATVYRAMRRQLAEALNDADKLAALAEGVRELSVSWAGIAPARAAA